MGVGSARAPRAVFRALAENFGGARLLRTALDLTRARANREGAVGSTRGACAPRALLGQIPLEHLDFVVDSKHRKLIPNPEHGDKQMSEEYRER